MAKTEAREGKKRNPKIIVFGGQNGIICQIFGECAGFVASIALAYDFRVFSQRFSDLLSALFSIMSRSFWRLRAAARVG